MKISNALKLLRTDPAELTAALKQNYSGEYLYGNKLLRTLAEYHPMPSVLCECDILPPPSESLEAGASRSTQLML